MATDSTATPTPVAVVRGNDYSSIAVPKLGEWTPSLSVSVVIPAHGHQDKLDLTLASLAAQTYPAELLEVIVVDDNSTPALRLPEIRPGNTRIVKPDTGWGSANAVNVGAANSTADVVMRLDADMVVYHHHVESQLRWHHRLDYAAVLGHKLFVDYVPGEHSPARIRELVAAEATHTLFDTATADRHWIEAIIDRTDALAGEDATAWRVFVGASGSTRRSLFDAAGGYDGAMILGGDTEFGYRLAQAGAVFIPDNDSSSWHLGRTQIQSRRAEAKRYRQPFQANRMPTLKYRDASNRHQWTVPLVDVTMPVADATLEQVRQAIDPLLNGHDKDVRITLLADWPDPHGRHQTLDDPHVDLRLIHETYHSEPRVGFATTATEPDPAVPYRLRLPVGSHTTRAGAGPLLKLLNTRRAGLLTITLPDGGTVRLERHAAFARARHLHRPGDELDSLVDSVSGTVHIDASSATDDETDAVDAVTPRRHSADDPNLATARRDLREAQQHLAAAQKQLRRHRDRLAKLEGRPTPTARGMAKRLLPAPAVKALKRLRG